MDKTDLYKFFPYPYWQKKRKKGILSSKDNKFSTQGEVLDEENTGRHLE